MNEQGNIFPLEPTKKHSTTIIPNQKQKGMISRSIKRKLIKAKVTLNQTLQQILDINKTRKGLPDAYYVRYKQHTLNEELKVLNKIVEHQANLIRKYEQSLAHNRRAS
jgi:hypothetical protein